MFDQLEDDQVLDGLPDVGTTVNGGFQALTLAQARLERVRGLGQPRV